MLATSVVLKKPIEELLLKFLEPSCEMYGQWIKNMQKHTFENFIKILQRAGEKIITFGVSRGFVPPRIATEILHDSVDLISIKGDGIPIFPN